MNSCNRDSVQLLKPDGTETGYQGIKCSISSGLSDKNESRNNILFCLEKYQITILATEFGVGSLDLPQYLEELGWNQKGNIAIVEDITNGAFMVHSETWKLNKIDYISSDQLLKKLFLDPLLSNYGVVIVNNVHKRSVLTDTVLALLKKILRKHHTMKILIVSNTKEAHFFCEYFNMQNHYKNRQLTCAITSIDDVNSKQSIFYLKSPCANYVKKSIETLANIHKNRSLDGDILLYLADENDINQAIELLRNYMNLDHIKNVNYFKVCGQNNEKESIFFPHMAGKRNVIFAEDLHQDSVTQHRVLYVIDCGFMQVKWFQGDRNMTNKIIVPVSRCIAEVRSNWGNKFRKAEVFRLYTSEDFRKLPERSVPKMRRTDLCSVILYLKTLAVDNILRFDFPSPPPAKNVLSALETLYALGAIDNQGLLTNPIGFFMSDISLCPQLSKALINSRDFDCSEEVLTIAAMLQVDFIFINTTNQISACQKQVAKRAFEASEGDLITLLNVYTAFVGNNKSKEFCRKYFLSHRNLMWVNNVRNYLASLLVNKHKITLTSCHGNSERLLKCIVSSYFMNAAYLHGSGIYKDLRSKTDLYVDRDSVIYSQSHPKYVIYCELFEKTKTYMKNLSVIKEEWLLEMSPQYYEAK